MLSSNRRTPGMKFEFNFCHRNAALSSDGSCICDPRSFVTFLFLVSASLLAKLCNLWRNQRCLRIVCLLGTAFYLLEVSWSTFGEVLQSQAPSSIEPSPQITRGLAIVHCPFFPALTLALRNCDSWKDTQEPNRCYQKPNDRG